MLWEDPTFYPHYLRAVAEGETVEFEGYYPPLGAWYGVRAYPSASGLSVYFQDITGRKEAEERLRFQAQLLGAVGEAVIALDTEGRVLYWNRAAEDMYGWSFEEIMGRRLREMVVPEDLQGLADEIAERLREGKSWAGEFEVRRRDGSTFPVEGTDTPVFGEDGHLIGVIGVLKDITERKRAEEEVGRLNEELENRVKERTARLESALVELGASEERYRLLVESAEDYAIFMVDTDGRVLDWNVGAQRIFGYRESEIVGELTSMLFTPEDVRSGVPERELRMAKEEGRAVDERRHVRKDGSKFWASGFVRPIRDDVGNLRGFAKVARDITERKRVEEALRDTREAERSRIARDLHDGVLQDLSYTAATMGLIMLEAEDTDLGDKLQGAIDAARRAAEGLRAAVNDLRVEAERDRTFPELVESLVERNRSMVHGYEIGLEVGEGLSAVPLGDAGTEILRMLQEALTNARRHSGADNVKVRLSEEGNELVAEVDDDGRGFEPGIGPGVGLESMRERAAALGGKLEIDSHVGQGTRVRLRVPLPQEG